MYDGMKIIPALALFLALVSLPVWYGHVGGAADLRDPEIAPGKKECVAPREYMKAYHMQMLSGWRDEVIRTGKRTPVLAGGEAFEKSLSKSCVKCHSNKAEFCDRCHSRFSVSPTCWECHISPKEPRNGN